MVSHAKLLKSIKDEIDSYDGHFELCKEWVALRTVVELHKPQPSTFDDDECAACSNAELSVSSPCETIKAIDKALA
jgi:hypothetical protein